MRLSGSVLLALCLTVATVHAQDNDAAVRSKIAAMEKAWNQAYKAQDIKALDGILDDGIVLINDDGSLQTKPEFLASVKTTTPSSQEQQVAPESLNVRVIGNVAIASGIFRAKGVEKGRPYTRRERFVDTWVNRSGKWVCVATNATPITQ